MAGSESFLKHDWNAVISPAVFSQINGLEEQVGNFFGITPATANVLSHFRQYNFSIEWEGELYAYGRTSTTNTSVYKYNPATLDWDVDVTVLANVNGGGGRDAAACLGLHPIEVNGIPYLYILYMESNGIWSHKRKESRFKGNGQWSAVVSQTLDSSMYDTESIVYGMTHDILISDNKLYTSFNRGTFVDNTSNRDGSIGTLGVFDFNTRYWHWLPQAGVSGYGNTAQGGASLVAPMALAKFKGTVYQMAREGLPQTLAGFQGTNILINSFPDGIVGGKVETVLIGDMDEIEDTTVGNLGEQNWIEGRYAMFVDRKLDKLFAIGYIRGSGAQGFGGTAGRAEDGWACWQLDKDINGDLINEGEVGHQCLPPEVRAGITTRIGNPKQSLRWTTYDIVDASGNTDIIIELAGGGEESDQVNTYRWVDQSTQMEFLGTGPGAHWSVPLLNGGGGEGIWSSRHPFDVTMNINPSGGAGVGEVELSSRVVGGTGQPVELRWFYATASGDLPNLICTIKNASSGSITSNVLTGAVADSGIEYTVVWEAQNNGVQPNSYFSIKSSAVEV